MDLRIKFTKWWKGREKIFRIQQGDDNLIAVVFYDKEMKYFSVRAYTYENNFFKLIELEERLKKSEALGKVNRIVREF